MLARTEQLPDDEESPIPDERLELIFACCHPALAPDAQVALTLSLVGGLTTPEIARAFLVPEPTLASSAGDLVLFAAQDRALWDDDEVDEGRRALDRAMALRVSGPYQLQAAIASLHFEPDIDWAQIVLLYARLAELAPSPSSVVTTRRATRTRARPSSRRATSRRRFWPGACASCSARSTPSAGAAARWAPSTCEERRRDDDPAICRPATGV